MAFVAAGMHWAVDIAFGCVTVRSCMEKEKKEMEGMMVDGFIPETMYVKQPGSFSGITVNDSAYSPCLNVSKWIKKEVGII